MDFKLTEQQTEMRAFVQDFAGETIAPSIDAMEKGSFPVHVIQQMGELGLMGIPIPKEYGGLGKDFVSYVIAIHEISKVSAAVGVILSVHTSVGTNPILHFGTEAQKKRYIPKLAKGIYLGAFALTEPHAGSDAARLKMRAEFNDDHFLLNGNKMFITNGKEADTFVTFARTNNSKGAKGISAFIAEKQIPGLTVGKDERKMGLHGTSTVMLHFEQYKLHQSQMLGEEGEGFNVAMANLNAGRIGIAAQAVGIAEAAVEDVTSFTRARAVREQGVLFKLADMATKVEAAKLLVYRAASMIDKEMNCIQEVSSAKLFATGVAREVTIMAIDLAGMMGAAVTSPLERYFRDAKVTEIYEGTSEIQRMVISKQLLK